MAMSQVKTWEDPSAADELREAAQALGRDVMLAVDDLMRLIIL